jgi:hypothetical protein
MPAMLRSLPLGLFFSATLALNAQWQWTQAVQCTGPDVAEGNSVALCPDGGLVVVGTFREQALFDAITLAVPGVDQVAGYVVKYDSLGTVLWAHQFEGTDAANSPNFNDVAVDASGYVLVLGCVRDTLLIDGAFATANGNGFPNARAFTVSKFDADGNLLWATDHEMNAANNNASAIAAAPNGDVWVAGQTGNDAGRLLRFAGTDGSLLTDVAGIIGWMYDVRTDVAGNAYATGLAPNVFTAGGMTCPLNQQFSGSTSRWVGKFDANGTALWYYVPPQGGSGYALWPNANLATTHNGSTFVEVDRKTVINGDTLAWDSYEHGIYLLDAAGTVQWTRRINDSGILYVTDMAADADGGVWVCGTMTGVVSLVDTTVNHQGGYLLHYNAAGALQGLVLGPNVTDLNAVAAGVNEVAVTGTFSSSLGINFGTHTLDGTWDMFAARYGLPNDVSVEERPNNGNVFAYPNPASDVLRLANVPHGIVQVELLDALGRIVLRSELYNPAQDVIDISQLPQGVFTVHVRFGTTRSAIRIVHHH